MRSSRERFLEIESVLTSYGFGHFYRTQLNHQDIEKDAVNLRLAFEELGPSFVKIGQILSTRRDLLATEYIEELEKLQSQVPPFAFSYVEDIFLASFGEQLGDVFAWVDEEPLACASIAQVHRGQLQSGEDVILKVQRPEVDQELLRDIHIFMRILELLPKAWREILLDPLQVLKEVERSAKQELDFRVEAANIMKFKNLNEERTSIIAPEVYQPYLGKKIMVQSYVPGLSANQYAELQAAGYQLTEVAEKIALSMFTQIFEDGFYHADPHPGNILISDGKICWLDFGIVGEFTPGTQTRLRKLMQAIYMEDIDEILELVLLMTSHPWGVDQVALYHDIKWLFSAYIHRSLEEVDISEAMMDLMHVTRRHQLIIRSEYSMLGKALITLEGLLSDLDPNINLPAILKHYMLHENRDTWEEVLKDLHLRRQLLRAGLQSARLPGQLTELLDNMNAGRFSIRFRMEDLVARWGDINRMINRIIMAVILAALILTSALIIINSSSTSISIFGIAFFVISGLLAIVLIISMMRSGHS